MRDEQDLLRMHVASSRANRRTRFSFGRLLEDEPLGLETEVVGGEDGRILPETIRIEFKLLEQSGMLKVVDTLDMDLADPSPVRRLAGKYVRKNFCTIVLRDVSQAGTAVRKVRLMAHGHRGRADEKEE